MIARVVGLCTLLTVAFLLLATVKAEEGAIPGSEAREAAEPQASQLTLEEITQRLDEVQKQLQALAEAVKALQPPPPEQPPKPTAKTDLVPVDRVTREEFNALMQLVYEQQGALGNVAKRISQSGMDRYVVNLRGAMEVPEFRQELAEAVHEVIRQQGTLRVENKSAVEHRLRVNGLEYLVPALATIEVDVPVGTLTTELVGYEAAKNWTVGPPNYHQGITITRTAPPTVFVAPPVIVDAPVFGPPVIVY